MKEQAVLDALGGATHLEMNGNLVGLQMIKDVATDDVTVTVTLAQQSSGRALEAQPC